MIYDINHKTAYAYSTPVSRSHHILHLAPRETKNQTIIRHNLFIEPAPATRRDHRDFFGNPTSRIDIDTKHAEFVVHARSTIKVNSPATVEPEKTLPWERLRAHLTETNTQRNLDVIQFLAASRLTQPNTDIEAYAQRSFPQNRPALDAALDLMHRIYAEFEFDGTATDVSTPIPEVLTKRRGVCQDFSHLALAGLRTMGVPARYVSGYLLTHPPEGQERLQGADASHAWISVWTPQTDWVDLDPTNNQIPSDEHITFAIGRDFDDVSPLRGILLGGSEHTVTVNVDVVPIDKGTTEARNVVTGEQHDE